MTSDDLAPGSLTVFQSSRVARPQDASNAPDLVSLLSSAQSYVDALLQRMLRPDSEVADIEARLGPASRYVDPVFQYRRRHQYVGFIRDLVKAGWLRSSSLPRRMAQRFITDARTSNRHLSPPSEPLLTGEGLCHVKFQGAPDNAQIWFVGSVVNVLSDVH